jgi:hypothetical protein
MPETILRLGSQTLHSKLAAVHLWLRRYESVT